MAALPSLHREASLVNSLFATNIYGGNIHQVSKGSMDHALGTKVQAQNPEAKSVRSTSFCWPHAGCLPLLGGGPDGPDQCFL